MLFILFRYLILLTDGIIFGKGLISKLLYVLVLFAFYSSAILVDKNADTVLI